MGDLVKQLGDLSGASDETAGLVIAIVALLLIVFGSVVLIVTIFGKWASTLEQDTSSRLLPTLVEDVLDIDLQRVYRRTLMLDDRVAQHFEDLAESTGTELGRRARQIVVRLQAERFSAIQEKGEPPEQEARLEEVAAVIDQALDDLPWDRPSATDSAAADQAARLLTAEKLEEFSTRVEPLDSERARDSARQQ